MSAIITDPFKKQLIQNVLDEVNNLTNRYYVGIGKNDQWNSTETVPTPTDTPKSIRDARTSLQSVKAVAAASYVVPRNSWSQGAIYDAYDDAFADYPTNSYYVLTEDNHVYICLQQIYSFFNGFDRVISLKSYFNRPVLQKTLSRHRIQDSTNHPADLRKVCPVEYCARSRRLRDHTYIFHRGFQIGVISFQTL